MLDLAHNAGDSIGEYVFSRFVGALPGAAVREADHQHAQHAELPRDAATSTARRVEARRLSVHAEVLSRTSSTRATTPILGLGSFLAGFTFEKSGEIDEALRYYDEALAFGGYRVATRAGCALAPRARELPSPRIKALAGGASEPARALRRQRTSGEILFVVGYGRVPAQDRERIPIGLALTLVGERHPARATRAPRTSSPRKGSSRGSTSRRSAGAGRLRHPRVQLDGQYVQLEEAVRRRQGGPRRVEEDRGQDHRQRHHAPDRAHRRRARAFRRAAGRDSIVGPPRVARRAGHADRARHARHAQLGDACPRASRWRA